MGAKTSTLLLTIGLALSAAAGCAPRERAGVDAAVAAETDPVVEELRTSNARLAELGEKLDALQASMANVGDRNRNDRGPDRAALAKLSLPASPTREQVEAYVGEIALETAKQQSIDDDKDPQVFMLAEAGRAHLEPLLAAFGTSQHMDRYLVNAIKLAAVDSQKGLVIDRLARHPQLLDVVTARGWAADATPVLLAEVENGRMRGNPQWVSLLSRTGDPAAKELLVRSFIDGPNRMSFYNNIKNLGGVDLGDAVEQAWQRSRTDPQPERVQTAAVAIVHGHADALQVLVDALPPTPVAGQPVYYNQPWGGVADVRSLVLVHVDFYGTNEEIREWYKANRARLRFEPQKKRFTVDETATPADGGAAAVETRK